MRAALCAGAVERAGWPAPAGTDAARAAAGFTANVARDGTVTTYRLRLPPSLLGLRPVDLSRGVALKVVANDGDGDGRKGVVHLSPGPAAAKDPARWLRFARP